MTFQSPVLCVSPVLNMALASGFPLADISHVVQQVWAGASLTLAHFLESTWVCLHLSSTVTTDLSMNAACLLKQRFTSLVLVLYITLQKRGGIAGILGLLSLRNYCTKYWPDQAIASTDKNSSGLSFLCLNQSYATTAPPSPVKQSGVNRAMTEKRDREQNFIPTML